MIENSSDFLVAFAAFDFSLRVVFTGSAWCEECQTVCWERSATMLIYDVPLFQFAIPVVAVILCVFLVFAFGFKSPGTPPTLDVHDDEEKLQKPKKSGGKKSVGGGDFCHAGEDDMLCGGAIHWFFLEFEVA